MSAAAALPPGFSAVVIATLAVGIGGTTAMFAVMQAVVLAPLPYSQPGELVGIYQQEPEGAAPRRGGASAPHFRTLRERATSFTDIAARLILGTSGGSTSPAVAIRSGFASCL